MTNTAESIYLTRECDINTEFIDTRTGKSYMYIGVLCAENDYYWCMYDAINGTQLLSCVGDIEGFGFEKVDK